MWQHEVEQDDVAAGGAAKFVRFFAIACQQDRMPLAMQRTTQQVGHCWLILGYQDFHRMPCLIRNDHNALL
jgi:hypothetical protein